MIRRAAVLAMFFCLAQVPARRLIRATEGVTSDIKLEYSVKIGPKTAELRYSITNSGPRDIFIFTPLLRYSGNSFVPAPERLYVFWGGDSEINLTKRLWQVPKGVQVYMTEVPRLTRLSHAKVFKETLQVPLPLALDRPYRQAGRTSKSKADPADREGKSKTLKFSVGYLPSSPSAAENPKPVKGTDMFSFPYGAGILRQKIVEGESQESHVAVRSR